MNSVTFKTLFSRIKNSTIKGDIYTRWGSTGAKVTVEMEKNVNKSLVNGEYKPRFHPGTFGNKVIDLPPEVKTAIPLVIGDASEKTIIQSAEAFCRYLHSRQLPTESDVLREKISQFRNVIQEKMNVNLDEMGHEERKHCEQVLNGKVHAMMKKKIFHWFPIDFTRHVGLNYLVSRGAAEYAVVLQIFREISRRAEFKPKTLFDFGTGVGTVIWAAMNCWNDSLKELYLVDTSREMIEISQQIMESFGNEKLMRKLFYRQFLPANKIVLQAAILGLLFTHKNRDINAFSLLYWGLLKCDVHLETKYDIVISSYTLLELPSSQARLEAILNLWNKTKDYLVLVEFGTMAGFKMINEARDFILSLDKGNNSIHIVSPCPHELPCPRVMRDPTPCNFLARFNRFSQRKEVRNELYSYVVFSKGPRPVSDPQWPRIVRPVLVRSRHSVCRLCTDSGTLQEVIFTQRRHGKLEYRCARSSRWGDLLPFKIKYPDEPSMEDES